jgi:His/Glu/Gln/Arg/opine family amino acid ABC transporter permease subunit
VPKLRRRTRQRLFRGSLYGLFIAEVLLVVLAADWENLQQQFFQPDVARALFPEIIVTAAKNTVLFTTLSFAGGAALGLVLALMKLSPVAPFRWLATAYIEIFRGIPALLTIFATSLVLPIAFGVNLEFLAGLVTMGAPATQWWINLSTSIVFGLGFATVLTLIVTPAALMWVENLAERRRRFFAWLNKRRAVPASS